MFRIKFAEMKRPDMVILDGSGIGFSMSLTEMSEDRLQIISVHPDGYSKSISLNKEEREELRRYLNGDRPTN